MSNTIKHLEETMEFLDVKTITSDKVSLFYQTALKCVEVCKLLVSVTEQDGNYWKFNAMAGLLENVDELTLTQTKDGHEPFTGPIYDKEKETLILALKTVTELVGLIYD